MALQRTDYEGQFLSLSAPHLLSPLFTGLADLELLNMDIPEEMLAEVRGLSSEQQLDALQSRLPVEGYEGLFLVAGGRLCEPGLRRSRDAGGPES